MKAIYKRPESVLVVVYTLGGEVLLLRRTRPRHFWQSVTGSLKWGETPREAAERELYEETGLRDGSRLFDCHYGVRFPIIHPWRSRYAPVDHYNREHWFLFPLSGRRTIRLNPQEHGEYRWLSVADALERVASWTNRDAIAQSGIIPPIFYSQKAK